MDFWFALQGRGGLFWVTLSILFGPIRLGALLVFAPLLASAATLYDADLALKAGDPLRVIKILDELLPEFPQASEESGLCLLKRAEALTALGRTEDGDALLQKIPFVPGLPPSVVREAGLRRIRNRNATAPMEARELARAWLRENPEGAQAASVRLLLADLLRREGDLTGALATLESIPQADRKKDYAAPLAESAKKIRLAVKARERAAEYRSAPAGARALRDLAAAEALMKESPRKAADACARIVSAPDTPPHLRLEAALKRVDCLDESDDPRGALAACSFLSDFDDPAPPERIAAARVAAAALTLDVGDAPAKSRALAEDALVVAPAESPVADEARWLVARAALRLNAPPEAVWGILSDSPAVKASTRRRDDPRHPVNRLIASAGSRSLWIGNDLGQPPPPAASALLRAADECFAATRYAEAARRYARAEHFGAPGLEARAYAALQRARATALSPDFTAAPALYRRFVSDKTLARSPYAPGALLRAGTLCEGRLRDTKQAREFFRLGYASRPDSEPAQACLIHLAESFADSGDRDGAINVYEDYLKKHPSGHHSATARTFLEELRKKKS